MLGAEPCSMCPKCDDCCGSCTDVGFVRSENRNAGDLSLSSIGKSSMLSTVSTISESSGLNFVYRRRKLQEDSIAQEGAPVNIKKKWDFLSAVCYNTPSLEAKEGCPTRYETGGSTATNVPLVTLDEQSKSLELEAVNGCIVLEEAGYCERPFIGMQKFMLIDSANDSCSSKSNTGLVSTSMKADVEETGECSSSSVTMMEVRHDVPLSEKELCISVLRSHGLLKRVRSTPDCTVVDSESPSTSCSNFRSCKTCSRSEAAAKMLICDSCDEPFHLSCCSSHIKQVQDDDWFCPSCIRKKHILVRQMVGKKTRKTITEVSRQKDSILDDLNPIALMLKDSDSYKSSVPVGKGFQADIPDWMDPVMNGVDTVGEPHEMEPLEYDKLHEHSNILVRVSSIGNWLQCRQVIEGTGSICGKWRRAPLFEVQTDNWECFCSVFWDPSHSDCAAPQELETDQVLKQLKIIEMLRPRLDAKRRRLVCNKADCSQCSSENRHHS